MVVEAGSTAVGHRVAAQGSPEEGVGLHSPGGAGLQAGRRDCRAGSSSPVAAAAVAAGDIEGPRREAGLEAGLEAGCSRSELGVEQEAAELTGLNKSGL